MKIRCGSHQQNRSIVRPGLSLMATKVALTAEEFRKNSQRSIDLFNTEKLSTDSTRVLKSVYCNSVHFCRCNLHGACGGKEARVLFPRGRTAVAICTERVEAKAEAITQNKKTARCNLHGACGGKGIDGMTSCVIQRVAICTERVEAKGRNCSKRSSSPRCNLHGACGGKVKNVDELQNKAALQSARSVWRQRPRPSLLHKKRAGCNLHGACGGKDYNIMSAAVSCMVAICTERVEAKVQM